jgi:hypothetical protein
MEYLAMKLRKFGSQLVVVCIVVLAAAAWARADLVYDFNDLQIGDITGQDGWSKAGGNSTASVVEGTAEHATNFLKSTTGETNITVRSISQSFAGNTAFEISVYSVAGAGSGSLGGFQQSGISPAFDTIGIAGFTTYLRTSSGDEKYGNTLTADHWYQVKADIDLSVAGGVATVYYRDVTDNQVGFTPDDSLHGVNLGLAAVDGKYTFTEMSVYLWGLKGTVDNLSISSVPEPSTLALLSCGLFGLLAYAWRKRR